MFAIGRGRGPVRYSFLRSILIHWLLLLICSGTIKVFLVDLKTTLPLYQEGFLFNVFQHNLMKRLQPAAIFGALAPRRGVRCFRRPLLFDGCR